MAWILRHLPDAAGAHEPGGVDPPKIALTSLAAVRTGTAASRNCAGVGYRCSEQQVPPVRRRGSGACLHTPTVQTALRNRYFDSLGSPDRMFLSRLNWVEPLVRDSYARWCGRGDAVKCALSRSIGDVSPAPDGPLSVAIGTHRSNKVAQSLMTGPSYITIHRSGRIDCAHCQTSCHRKADRRSPLAMDRMSQDRGCPQGQG